MVNRIANNKLARAIGGHATIEPSDTVNLPNSIATQDVWFKDLEQAILASQPINHPFPVEQGQEICRTAKMEDIITKVDDKELKAYLQCMYNIGYHTFVVWKDSNINYTRFDGYGPEGFVDFFDVIDYDVSRLKPVEPEIQYVEEPQIEYVEQPQIEYVEQPQIEYVEEPQYHSQYSNEFGNGGEGPTYFTQPQRLKRIGGTMQGITNTPFVPVQKIQRHYYQRQQIQQPPTQQQPQGENDVASSHDIHGSVGGFAVGGTCPENRFIRL